MKKFFIWFIIFCFGINILWPEMLLAQIDVSVSALPVVGVTENTQTVLVKGLNIDASDPYKFEFIIDEGASEKKTSTLNSANLPLGNQNAEISLRLESEKLIKYFLASLAIPEDQMWVNLSPYEKNRIVPEMFGHTDMGRDLLAQDYMLKQLVSSLIKPDGEFGQKFWDEVYRQTQEKFKITDIPLNTFNKVWIVPDTVKIYEHDKGAFITEARLKVMLDEDYLALEMNQNSNRHGLGDVKKEDLKQISGVSTEIFRQIILPAVEKEVNEGKTFSKLRQIYYSMLLANWYKRKLKEAIIQKEKGGGHADRNDSGHPFQNYIDHKNVKGIIADDPQGVEKIYNQYIYAFEQGAYNLIKEDYDPINNQIIPRKYFSGGVNFQSDAAMIKPVTRVDFINKLIGLNLSLLRWTIEKIVIPKRISDPGLEPLRQYLLEQRNPPEIVEKLLHLVSGNFNERSLFIGSGKALLETKIALDNPNIAIIASDLFDANDADSDYQEYTRVFEEEYLTGNDHRRQIPNLAIVRADVRKIIELLPRDSIDELVLLHQELIVEEFVLESLKRGELMSKLHDKGRLIIKPFHITSKILRLKQLFSKSEDEGYLRSYDTHNYLMDGMGQPIYFIDKQYYLLNSLHRDDMWEESSILEREVSFSSLGLAGVPDDYAMLEKFTQPVISVLDLLNLSPSIKIGAIISLLTIFSGCKSLDLDHLNKSSSPYSLHGADVEMVKAFSSLPPNAQQAMGEVYFVGEVRPGVLGEYQITLHLSRIKISSESLGTLFHEAGHGVFQRVIEEGQADTFLHQYLSDTDFLKNLAPQLRQGLYKTYETNDIRFVHEVYAQLAEEWMKNPEFLFMGSEISKNSATRFFIESIAKEMFVQESKEGGKYLRFYFHLGFSDQISLNEMIYVDVPYEGNLMFQKICDLYKSQIDKLKQWNDFSNNPILDNESSPKTNLNFDGDPAMLKGGIDLNSKSVKISENGVFVMPLFNKQDIDSSAANFDEVSPVIIQISPIKDINTVIN